tara:strand:- start:13187 stop:14581 length:1395 start_codon:yes stop_codon:yes gene_type:complete
MNQLNNGQEAASVAFAQFLFSDSPFFVISGPAGTGKTFLMNYLSNKGLQDYTDGCALIGIKPVYTETVFTATTNKAAEVLETSIGKPVQTIHSYLGLKVRENYKTGKTDIEKSNTWRVRSNKVVFIDECSMIDSNLFKFLLEGFTDSKIVFVGDHAQMAPVGETLSPIYTEVSLGNFAALFEPVRNAGSPALIALCDQLRDTVETGIFKPMAEVPGVIDYLNDDQMEAAIMHEFQDLDPSARVLCYTNERVQMFNDHIRTDVRHRNDPLTPGDTVVVARAFQLGKTTLSVERELVISSVSEAKYNHDFDLILGEFGPLVYVDVGFRGFSANPDDGSQFTLPVCLNTSHLDYVLKHYSSRKNWRDFYDLRNSFLDIRDKAACTVYKSQGSTYDTVFVDIGNIGTSFDAQQVARMLYVAVSRARTRVCFYGQLPARYHSTNGVPAWTRNPGPKSSPTTSVPETVVA